MRLRSLFRPTRKGSVLPADGYTPSAVPIERLDRLSDDALRHLNGMLDWNCFTVDSRGRRFGNLARPGKRDQPQTIPDRRIGLFDAEFGLQGRSVLEVGCFEGIHTIGLAQAGARVTAVDARMENIAKAILRCHFHGVQADIRCCNVENDAEVDALPEVDLLHHIGVLYHLARPVQHLRRIARKVRVGVMLDTHVAHPDQASDSLTDGGLTLRCRRVGESLPDVFSGVEGHANWLLLDDLLGLLREAGFADARVLEERAERNGPRVLIFARR